MFRGSRYSFFYPIVVCLLCYPSLLLKTSDLKNKNRLSGRFWVMGRAGLVPHSLSLNRSIMLISLADRHTFVCFSFVFRRFKSGRTV